MGDYRKNIKKGSIGGEIGNVKILNHGPASTLSPAAILPHKVQTARVMSAADGHMNDQTWALSTSRSKSKKS